MEFIAAPKMEEIAVKAFSRGETKWGKLSITTTVYISWNGATEVNEWEIYNAENGEGDGSELWNSVGRVKKTGFETVFANTGYLALCMLGLLIPRVRSWEALLYTLRFLLSGIAGTRAAMNFPAPLYDGLELI